jgi:c-di-GMP-related signal transduction protein
MQPGSSAQSSAAGRPTSVARPQAVAEPPTEAVFIARQPLFDSRKAVIGYELLFRSGEQNAYTATDGRLASAQTISRALNSIGLDTLVGTKKAFINFTHDLVLDETYTVLPPEQCVVELLESAPVNDEVVAACKKLKDAGYQLALDDVISRAAVERLLPYCDYIKLDLRAVEPAKRAGLVRQFADQAQKLVAEKVETAEDFDQAIALGCRYAQGYFFCKPEVVKGKGLAGIETIYLQLLRELNRPQLDYDHIESLIKKDVSLSYKLLRYMNSVAVGVRHEVTAVRQALVLLGERPLRKWLALVAFTSMSRKKPTELLLTCLVRGNFCEAVAKATHLADRQLELFLVGLLSGLDAALDTPMERVLAQINLPETVRAVLLNQPSAPPDLSRVFGLAQACERGAWGSVMQAAAALRLTQPEVAMMYYDSLAWANQTSADKK